MLDVLTTSCHDVGKEDSNMKTILKLDHLEKEYGQKENKVTALKDINLDVNEGEFVAIVGTSGSGKSTLLNLIV